MGDAWRTCSPGTGATAWRPHRNSFERGAEVSPGLSRNRAHTPVCWHSSFANQKLKGVEYTKGTVAARKQGALQSREFGPEPPARERQAWDWNSGAECLRFAEASQIPSQTGEPNPTGLQAVKVSESRLRSILLCTFPQGKEENALPDTTCYMVPRAVIY